MSIIKPKNSATNNDPLRKTNQKLPKLTIQQQIDNQDVIERMNRKITFTKNQRHLGKTIAYNQALVEEAPSVNSTIFSVEPTEVLFTDYRLLTTYQAQIKLVNKSKLTQRIKITPLKKKQFVVAKVKYPNENSGDIAPGMSIIVAIRFRPTDLHDNEDELIVIVGDGVIKVPIYARREKCKGQWPQVIQCGHCWVGDQIIKTQNVKNKGGQAIYHIKSNIQDHQPFIVGPFTIQPKNFQIKTSSSENTIKIRFRPQKSGLFEEYITYKSDQGEQQQIRIKVVGGAYTAHLTLDEINNQKVKLQKFQNYLYLNNCEPGETCTSNLKINNHAVVPVDYFWHFNETSEQITIKDQSGKIKPSEVINFTFQYCPQTSAPKLIPIHLYLYNLPEQSLENNSKVRIIDGLKAIQCLEVIVRTNSRQSNLEVTPLHQNVLDPLFVGHTKTARVKVINRSDVTRRFDVKFIKKTDFWKVNCKHFLSERERQEGVNKTIEILGKDTVEIEVEFQATSLTKQSQFAYLLIEFDNAPAKMISFQGQVEFPDLQLIKNHIDFGLTRVRSQFRQQFELFNKGENPVNFKISNPYRFYTLDFYDMYEFQNEDYYLDRLKITLKGGQECRDWVSVPPNSSITLEFQFHTEQQQSIELELELSIMDGPNYPLKVSAEVQSIIGNLSRENITLKQIYKGNIYNSNKFLSKQIAIINQGNLDFTYEIMPELVDQCNISLTPLKKLVSAKRKQRLDAILEPIKTGKFSASYQIKFYDNVPLYSENYSSLADTIQIVPENRKNLMFSSDLKIQSEVKGVEINYYIKDETRAKRVRQKIEDPMGSVKLSAHSFKSGSKSHYLQADKLVYPFLQQVNFYNCEINKVQQMEIIIENDSGLTTQYEIYAEKFHTDVKESSTPRENQNNGLQTDQLAFTSEMGKAYLQSRVLDKAQKIHLSNNKGISIMCEPSSGHLHKKQQQKITITMFNDTSGKFRDQLVISVKDHEVKKFPINLQIKGTPVSLSRNQMGINFNNETPSMDTGTFFIKNGVATKNIKVVNNGPKQVLLKWLFYNHNEREEGRDFFNISLQEAESGSGKLIEPKWDAIKPSLCKQPPFSIQPIEKVMKGREQVNFTLSIHQCEKLGNFSNLLIGEPFLIEGDMKRQMECLAVVLEGQAVEPNLKLDQKHKNHIQKLQRFAEIGKQERTKANDHHRKIKLKNLFRSNLTFKISVSTTNGPQQNFILATTDTDSPLNKLKIPTGKTLNSSNQISKLKSIRPPSSQLGISKLKDFQVQKQFTLPYESFVEIGVDLLANLNDKNDWPLEEKFRKDGTLTIQFSNGNTQQIQLVGWLYRPFIKIEMPNSQLYSNENMMIDFGTVHVKNSKKMSVYLANPSKSAANWSIYYVKYHQSKPIVFEKQLWTDEDYEDEKITDEKKCFRLSQDSGHLLAQSIPIHYMPTTLALNHDDDKHAQEHRPQKIDFLFKPQSNNLYKSKFIISVEHGIEYPIIVKGRGTYEEEKEFHISKLSNLSERFIIYQIEGPTLRYILTSCKNQSLSFHRFDDNVI